MYSGISERNVIRRLASLRSNMIELVLITIVLSFGLGLAASSLANLLNHTLIWGLTAGIWIAIGSFRYLFLKVLAPQPETFVVCGFLHLVQKSDTVSVRPVNRYELSEKVSDYLRAAFSENQAILRAWLNKPTQWLPSRAAAVDGLTGNSLVNQAVEYFFLDCLSLHLISYFHEQGIEEDECQKFTRGDIPDVLLQNRFLELFSKPIEEREQFIDDYCDNGRPHGLSGQVVMAHGAGGALFDRFELILPKGSKVFRSADGILRIETTIFSLEFTPGIDGFNTVTPRNFEELYMEAASVGMHSPPWLVKSKIRVTIKKWALCSRSGWEYYGWLDSFINEYYRKACGDEFLRTIGWEFAVTTNQIASALKLQREKETK